MSENCNFKEISVYASPQQSPGFLLWHISNAWRSSIEAVLVHLKLTHPQFVVLAATGWLTSSGALVNQALIAKMAGLDPNTNSQVIKGLEQKELITRASSSDARAKNVFLTKKGSDILNQALPAVEKADAQFFSLLKRTELNLLIQTFQKFIPKDVTV